MGLDFLDTVFRCEREFGIKLNRDEIGNLFKEVREKSWFSMGTHDLCVRDFVALVEANIRLQNPASDYEVFERIRTIIGDCLAVEESDVKLESWLVQDLGMD